jgi:hypothetical protein
MKIILADESVDFNIVRRLREADYEIEAIIETTPGIIDEEVLQAANKLEGAQLGFVPPCTEQFYIDNQAITNSLIQYFRLKSP